MWWSVHDGSARTENLKVLRRHDLSIFLPPTLQSTAFAHNVSLLLSFTICAFCYTSTLSLHQPKGTESRFSFPLELIRHHFSNQSPSASKLRRYRLVIPYLPGHFFSSVVRRLRLVPYCTPAPLARHTSIYFATPQGVPGFALPLVNPLVLL